MNARMSVQYDKAWRSLVLVPPPNPEGLYRVRALWLYVTAPTREAALELFRAVVATEFPGKDITVRRQDVAPHVDSDGNQIGIATPP